MLKPMETGFPTPRVLATRVSSPRGPRAAWLLTCRPPCTCIDVKMTTPIMARPDTATIIVETSHSSCVSDAARTKLGQIDGGGFLAAGRNSRISRAIAFCERGQDRLAPTRISAVTAIEQAQSPFPYRAFSVCTRILGEDGAGGAFLSYLEGGRSVGLRQRWGVGFLQSLSPA